LIDDPFLDARPFKVFRIFLYTLTSRSQAINGLVQFLLERLDEGGLGRRPPLVAGLEDPDNVASDRLMVNRRQWLVP
jgi:hypothetical protein